jgi:hypothetical protein
MVEALAMRIVLLGEQATGKSSMLVALYGALLHRRAGEMRIVRTNEDVEFLSRGLEALGRLESVRRTEADADARVALAVSHATGTVAIEMPDRSGDQLRNMIDTRLWDPQLQRQVDMADAAMLFLRADWLLDLAAAPAPSDPFEPPLGVEADGAPPDAGEQLGAATKHGHDETFVWSTNAEEEPTSQRPIDGTDDAHDGAADPFVLPADAGDVAPGSHEEPGDDGSTEGATEVPASEPVGWAPSRMPVDVRAVDLLQELLEERSTRLPVVVIVSAWDRAAGTTPADWLAEQLPLLEQFLACNSEQLPHAVFGVSAQGVAFDEAPTDEPELADPWDRAYLVRPDGVRGTVADPIEWLIDTAA